MSKKPDNPHQEPRRAWSTPRLSRLQVRETAGGATVKFEAGAGHRAAGPAPS